MTSILANNLEAIRAVCRQRHVQKLYAFGSAVRGDMHEKSDVDFLYSFDPLQITALRKAGFSYAKNLFALEADLQNILQRPVDLLPDGELRNPVMRDEIAASKQLLYAAG